MKTGTIKWFDPLLKNGFIKQDKGDYVVSWKLLNAMEVIDWIDALKEALKAKSEAEKKELEKRLKILQFEMDELKETFE